LSEAAPVKKGKKRQHFGSPRPAVFQGRYDSNATPSFYIFGFFSPVEIE
jgi:hypothetical protein